MTTSWTENALRRLVMGTPFEPWARVVWKKVLRRKTQNDLYDEQTLAIMRRTLRSDSNCVDVGCHQGSFLDEMLTLAPEGTHFAFEPLPSLFEQLQSKYRNKETVILNKVALSDVSGTTPFHFNRDHPGYSGIRRRDYPSDKDRVDVIEVRTDRLDAVIPLGHKIDFIKIDVEGAELSVLEGACEHLRQDGPTVVFEHGVQSCQYYGTSSGAVYTLLAGCNLKVSLLSEYLHGGVRPLSESGFEHQVDEGLNYYFVAHR